LKLTTDNYVQYHSATQSIFSFSFFTFTLANLFFCFHRKNGKKQQSLKVRITATNGCPIRGDNVKDVRAFYFFQMNLTTDEHIQYHSAPQTIFFFLFFAFTLATFFFCFHKKFFWKETTKLERTHTLIQKKSRRNNKV